MQLLHIWTRWTCTQGQLPGKRKMQWPSCQYRHKYHTFADDLLCSLHCALGWIQNNNKMTCGWHRPQGKWWKLGYARHRRENWGINTIFLRNICDHTVFIWKIWRQISPTQGLHIDPRFIRLPEGELSQKIWACTGYLACVSHACFIYCGRRAEWPPPVLLNHVKLF